MLLGGRAVLRTAARTLALRQTAPAWARAASARPLHATPLRSMADATYQHKDSVENNADIPFEFTDENYETVFKILKKYPKAFKQSAIMPLLDLAQRQEGWIPLSAMNKIAQICEVAPMRVYEVATFYTMYNRKKVGKYFIQLCGTTPCMVRGAEDILQTIQNHLGIKKGQTTPDGLFTLIEVECLGACVNAPMIQINDDFFEDLTPETTIALLDNLKAGRPVQMGPQNGRKGCIGSQGKTSLLGPPNPPYCRDIDAAK